MLFSDIMAQERAVEFLKKCAAENRLSHSYIFSGPPGVGKMTTAAAFVAAMCCHFPEEGSACGECNNCRRIKSGNYPHITYVSAQGKTIKIEQVRQVLKSLKFKPPDNIKRYIIIDKGENMTPEAGNSLLRSLEEPPEKTLFIITTDNLNGVLPTIVSRCQIINFNRLSSDAVLDILSRKGYSEEKISPVAPVSRGSVSYAVELMEDKDVLSQRQNVISFLSQLPTFTSQVLDFAHEIKSSYNISLCMDLIFACYRDILVWGATGNEALLANKDFIRKIEDNGNLLRHNRERLFSSLENIIDAQKALSNNVNQQLVFEALLIQLNENASS